MQKTVVKRILNSKGLMIAASLLAAVVIWVNVSSSSEMEMRTKQFTNVPVRFAGQNNLRDAKGLVVTNVENSTVTLTVRGSRSDLARLESTDLTALIDLSTISTTGFRQISYNVQFPLWVDTTVVTTTVRSPSTISFYVDKLGSKMVEVIGEFSGSIANSYIAEPITITPSSLYVSGAEEELKRVSKAVVRVPRDNVDATISSDLSYVFVDKDGEELELQTIECETEAVNFHMPILMTKAVALQVHYSEGGGATAANVIAAFEEGKGTITLAGTPEELEQLNQLSIGTVNLASFVSTYEEKFTIPIPNNMRNISGFTEVEVKFEIVGLATKKLTVSNIECINTPTAYKAELLTSSLDITVRAPQAVLDVLESDHVRVNVDLTDVKSTGSIRVNGTVLFDGYPEAGAVMDYPVTVLITD